MACLLLALVLLAAASGVLVRDIGAATRASQSGGIQPFGLVAHRFYAYELTYELAIFSTVRVNTTVEALFGDWRLAFESNGSLVASFRPDLPGVHQVTVRNVEDRDGNFGMTILQQNTLPPDMETSLINPLLYAAAILFSAAVAASAFRKRIGRGKGS